MNPKIISALLLSVLCVVSIAMAEDFEKNSHLQDLSAPVRCFFDAVAQNDSSTLMGCFT
jgi:hypothetical protein